MMIYIKVWKMSLLLKLYQIKFLKMRIKWWMPLIGEMKLKQNLLN